MLSAMNTCSSSVTFASLSASGLQAPQQYPEGLTPGARSDVRPTAADPKEVDAEIMRLAGHGIYSFPVNITVDPSGKKVTKFPVHWKQLTTVDKWKSKIKGVLRSSKSSNGLAVMTEPSNLYCVDVDVASSIAKDGKMKRFGIEIWKKLVTEHGEPQTLKVITGSGGFHYYFDVTTTIGLNQSNDFAGLIVDSIKYGVDGRGTRGLLYAPPARYLGKHGKSCGYSWAPEGDGIPHAMPAWLVDTINRGRSTGAAPSIAVPDSAPPGPAVDGCGEVDQNLASEDEPVQPTRPVELVAAGAKPVPFLQDGSLVRELQKLLKEKANDSSSTYGSSLPHGLYGTFYCFRTTGPRTCFFGREHSGSNNFNLLKRGRDVFYRCHGDLCSHEPVRKLGELTLEAGLQDATNEAVSPQDQMNLFRKYREQGKSQFLAFVAEVARDGNGEPFAGLAKIFSHIYKIEGRILNTGDRKTFFYWDGRGWVEDTCNKVLSVFAAQMGALLSWYGMEFVVLFKKLFADKLCESNPGLKDLDQATLQKHVQDPKNKLLRDECKQLAGNILPEIRFNVQDPTIVKKCLHYVVTDLYVSDLSSHMNENPLLVNFQNGVGYIPTGEPMKPHPPHLCSLVAGGEYHAKPTGTRSKFKEFLLDIANNDEDVVRWKILYLGYGMSGYTDEEIVNFWWGEGGNGKGALKQAILAAWGEYAIICSKHIFMKTKDDTASAASSHLAQLKGVRFGLADELDDGQTINAATIKEQTGGGKISARELFEKMKNFIPTHKLVLLTNNKPRIPVEEVNAGLLRRIVLEPYLNQYMEDSEYNPNIPHHRRADVGLKMYLESKEGIEDVIRLTFEGARDWYKIRTAKGDIRKALWPRPQVFTKACNEYLKENDTLSTFLEQYCLVKANEVIVQGDFCSAYKMSSCDDPRMTTHAITKALKGHNITTDEKHPKVPKQNGSGSGRPYIGVRLLTSAELDERKATAERETREWQEARLEEL